MRKVVTLEGGEYQLIGDSGETSRMVETSIALYLMYQYLASYISYMSYIFCFNKCMHMYKFIKLYVLSHSSETSGIRKSGLIETLVSYPTEHFLLPGLGWTTRRRIVCCSLVPYPVISSACPFQLLGIGGEIREEMANVFVLNDSH